MVGLVSHDIFVFKNFNGPVAWADFSGSSQTLGTYSGETSDFPFTFESLPVGDYFLIAFIDVDGVGLLELSNGEPYEPAGAFPVENGEPYRMHFDYYVSNAYIPISAEGYMGRDFMRLSMIKLQITGLKDRVSGR